MTCYQINSKPSIYYLLSDITKLYVDCIVHFVGQSRDSKVDNQLSSSIFSNGGNQLGTSFEKAWYILQPDFDTVIITESGDLNCKNVMHTFNLSYKEENLGYRDAIKKKIYICLEKAEKEKYESLALPVIHQDSIQELILEFYHEHFLSDKMHHIKNVYCVFDNKKLIEKIGKRFSTDLTECEIPTDILEPAFNPEKQGIGQHSNDIEHSGATASTNSWPGPANWSSPTDILEPAFNPEKQGIGQHSNDIEHSGATASTNSWPGPANWSSSGNNSEIAITSGRRGIDQPAEDAASSGATASPDQCPICLCDITDEKTLDKCGHSFCSDCIDNCFSQSGPSCPICQTLYGQITGLQPPGVMTVEKNRNSLPGFPGCGMYILCYEIFDGVQQKEHPNPGKQFYGTRRTAFLPAHVEGSIVLKMLQKAFRQKLIFTVGFSRTNNRDNVITWNDIHHKTSIHGGPTSFGYPDPDYLKRVTLELEAKGVDAKSVEHEQILYSLRSN